MNKELLSAKKEYREAGRAVREVLVRIFGEEVKNPAFDPDDVVWVDLGLPSGRLWAKENVEGYFKFDEAVEKFGEYLPMPSAFVELIENCQVEWNGDKKGLEVTGPNGKSIFFPALGYVPVGGDTPKNIGYEGNYWSRMPYLPKSKSFAPYSQASARYLYFSSGLVNPLYNFGRAIGFSVRPAKELS